MGPKVKEFEKERKLHKEPKATKTDLTPLPTKPEAPKKKLAIRAPPVEKPEEISKLKPEEPLEASITKIEAIKKFDEYIEQLNIMVQKLDMKFGARVISQEEYLEKKTILAEKLGEAMAKRDKLSE